MLHDRDESLAETRSMVRQHETDTDDRFRTLEGVASTIRRFERAQLDPHEWNHDAHLVVAAWFLMVFSRAQGTARIIEGIRRLNRAHGVRSTPTSGYHETISMFWIAVMQHVLRPSTRANADIMALVREVLDTYGHRPGAVAPLQ